MGTSRSSDEDKPVSNSLDLTSLDIFRNLATLVEQETKGNEEGQTYIDNPPPRRQ